MEGTHWLKIRGQTHAWTYLDGPCTCRGPPSTWTLRAALQLRLSWCFFLAPLSIVRLISYYEVCFQILKSAKQVIFNRKAMIYDWFTIRYQRRRELAIRILGWIQSTNFWEQIITASFINKLFNIRRVLFSNLYSGIIDWIRIKFELFKSN